MIERAKVVFAVRVVILAKRIETDDALRDFDHGDKAKIANARSHDLLAKAEANRIVAARAPEAVV
jgi:hypothetical protein